MCVCVHVLLMSVGMMSPSLGSENLWKQETDPGKIAASSPFNTGKRRVQGKLSPAQRAGQCWRRRKAVATSGLCYCED